MNKLDVVETKAEILHEIAVVYDGLEEYKNALDYFRKAKSITPRRDLMKIYDGKNTYIHTHTHTHAHDTRTHS